MEFLLIGIFSLVNRSGNHWLIIYHERVKLVLRPRAQVKENHQ
jgi:hypothetical protein